MPSIPRAKRTRTIPGVSGAAQKVIGAPEKVDFSDIKKISAKGVPGVEIPEGLGDEVVWKEVGRASDTLFNIIQDHAADLKRQDENNREILLRSQFDDDRRAFLDSERQKTGSDAYKNVERGKEFREDMLKKYTKDIESPDLKTAVTQYIQSRGTSLLDSLSSHQAKQRDFVGQQARGAMLTGLLKDAYDGGSLEDVNQRWANVIAEQNETGAISDEEAIEHLRVGQASIAEAHLDGLISASPNAAIQAIEIGMYNEFLTQEQMEGYDKKAKRMKEAIEKDAENVRKEQERLDKEALKEAQKETGDVFIEKLLDGTLTHADILGSNLDPTGENSKSYWAKQVTARFKASKLKDEFETNKEVEADFQTRITLGEDVPDEEIMEAQGNGLSTEDAKSLIKYKQSMEGEDPQKTQDAKIAYRRLRDAKTARMYSSDRVKNAKGWAADVKLLQQWIKNHPGEDPVHFVDKLLDPVKDNLMDDIYNFFSGKPGEEEAYRAELEMEAGYGARPDGTEKGPGFLGEIEKPDGRVMTEYSIGIEIDGKETQIPTIVPTLTDEEVEYLRTSDDLYQKPLVAANIIEKAITHAKKRISEGMSPFKEAGETKTITTQIFRNPDGTYVEVYPDGTERKIPKPEGLD